jgi:hypothetical protein
MYRRHIHFNNAFFVDHLSQRFLCSDRFADRKNEPVFGHGRWERQLQFRDLLVCCFGHNHKFRSLYRAFYRSGFRISHH